MNIYLSGPRLHSRSIKTAIRFAVAGGDITPDGINEKIGPRRDTVRSPAGRRLGTHTGGTHS